ncbi:MAG: pyruvate kinase [Vicinamibacterales bacterium]
MPTLQSLLPELRALDLALSRLDRATGPFLAGLPASQIPSATNLLHYLVLRRHDLRLAQPLLAAHGLSSLGRTESHVRSGLDAVLRLLHLMTGTDWSPSPGAVRLSLEDGEALLRQHTGALLGPEPDGRTVRIMVTMPTEAAHDYAFVRDLVSAGMDCMRVNCAHDGPDEWARMITHLRRASKDTGRACTVCMDIAGPKLRTGPVEAGPAVLKIKPSRDAWGRVAEPAVVALVPPHVTLDTPLDADAVLRLDRALPPGLAENDVLTLIDARQRCREFRVFARTGGAVLTLLARTAYIAPGTAFRVAHDRDADVCTVASVPPREQVLTLKPGERVVLTSDAIPGRPAIRDPAGRVIVPAQIGVTLPEVFADVKTGESIWFDDGRIGGFIREGHADHLVAEITQARRQGETLRAGKGINLPDTDLRLDALTSKDLDDLRFVATHADLVGYSFVRRAEDVRQLQAHLASLDAAHLGIVLKIETRRAFDELPRLLLACMKTGRFGVMIARGDLAIECGFERLAEVQEEILWIAEAAHAPVIWGTQVLETLAKSGVPSRAEVTDAAMAERAECVMLNKGPFVAQAVRTLDDILRRMQSHQTKKRAMLRPLQVAQAVLDEALIGSGDVGGAGV